ncbi:hypothetical protein GC175_31295 [bacterium]|nr:hypothetical protein [bacterium]
MQHPNSNSRPALHVTLLSTVLVVCLALLLLTLSGLSASGATVSKVIGASRASALNATDAMSSTIYLPALSQGSATIAPTPTPAPTDPPPSDEPLSAEERVAVVDNVTNVLNTVVDLSVPFEQRDLVQEMIQAAQAIAQDSQIATVVLFTETLTMQAVMVDGFSVLINGNRPPQVESDSNQFVIMNQAARWSDELEPSAMDDNVPGSRRIVSVAFDGGASVAAAVRNLLVSKGYVNTGLGTSIDDMKNYKDLGVLYLDTHGTGWQRVTSITANSDGTHTIRWGDLSFSLQTSSEVNVAALGSTYKADVDAGRLTLNMVQEGDVWRAKLGITERFITHYWDLDDAIVMIHACFSGAGRFTSNGQCYGSCDPEKETVYDPRSIRQAIIGAGASVLVSFDNYTNADVAGNSILFFFDRLLGSNEQSPTTPPTRPFNFAEVWGEMGRRNLTIYNRPAWVGPLGISIGGNTVNLNFDAKAAGGSSTALAPSIRTVDVLDDASKSAGTVEIYGSFGDQQGKVEVDGVDVPVTSWSKTKIVASPPWDGIPSRGYLVVKTNDSVRSNFIPFTEWRGTVTVTYRPGPGSLEAKGEVKVRVRADLHDYRESINGAPQPRNTQRAYFTGGSSGNSTGSGIFSEDGDTIQYLGGEALPLLSKAQVDTFASLGRSARSIDAGADGAYVGGFIDLNAQNRTARLCFIMNATFTQRITGEGGSQDLPTAIPYVAGLGLEDNTQGLLSCFNLGMTTNYSLPAGSRTLNVEESSFRIEWTEFTPFAEPTDRTPG